MINSTEEELNLFIRTGCQFARTLRFLYIVTPHKDVPVITELNRSSALVSIVAVTEEQHVTKPPSYLDLYRAMLEP